MASVGGLFHRREDAEQVADALILAGVEASAIRFDVLPDSIVDALGLLGIPEEAIREYLRQVVPGDILLAVNTRSLPEETIVNEIGRNGGLAVQLGRAPSAHPGER